VRTPAKDPIVAAFDRLAQRHGERPLLVSATASVTVAQIDALARGAARRLGAQRLAAGVPIALCGANGSGFLAAWLACRRRGHPVALFDPGATAREIGEAAGRLGIAAVITTRPGAAPGAGPRLLRVGPVAPSGARRARAARQAPAAGRVHEAGQEARASILAAAAVIKMTSGSSGRPRGVACSSEALLADDTAIRAAMGIGDTDRLVAAVPFAHSYGLSSLVVPALTRGIPLLLPEPGSPLAPWIAAQTLSGTVLPTVPAFVAGLVALADAPPWPATLRLLVTAGAPLWPETALLLRRRTGRLPHVFYGASECGGISYDPTGEAGERGTAGVPLPGVRLRLEPVPGAPARAGRLLVESPSTGIGYLPAGEPTLGGGRFLTSDLARRRGDEVVLLGRLDAVINVRGRKIDPREVERHIARLRPVRDVVVHAVQAARGGEPRVRAVVACPAGSLDGEAIRRWCRGRLGVHKVPREILIVPALPLTARGKIDREAVSRLPSRPAIDA
jgi:long-chain acyl-CoA synthetase